MGKGLSARNQRRWKGSEASALMLCLALAVPAPAFAQPTRDYNYSNREINQTDSQGYSANNYYNGSHDSEDEGYRNGARALGRLAALDIGGAIHYGYKGYGNYINSENMDDLDSISHNRRGKMGSAGMGAVSGASGGGAGTNNGDYVNGLGPEREGAKLPDGFSGKKSDNSSSTVTRRRWSDRDKSFLYRGETGEVMTQLEKATGISRETYANHVASIVDARLSFDDPELLNKLEQRFNAFRNEKMNPDFKSKLDKVHSMFSYAKKTEMLQEAAAFFAKNRAKPNGEGGNQMLAGPAPAPAGDVPASGNGSAAASGDRAPASAGEAQATVALTAQSADPKQASLTKEQMGMYLGLESSHGEELKDILGNTEDTIFKLVSKRYRKLTPGLLGRAM